MSVHRSKPVGMGHEQSLPISSVQHHDARHIAFRHTMNRFARHASGLDVQSVMKMIGAQFPEVRAQQKREIERRTEIGFHLSLRTKGKHRQQCQCHYDLSLHSLNFLKTGANIQFPCKKHVIEFVKYLTFSYIWKLSDKAEV